MEQKLAEYREPAPTVSWDKLNQALEHGTRHRRIVTLWSRRIAAAAVVLLATVGGYWAFHSRPTVQPSIATIPPHPQAQPIARQSQQPQPITAIADRPRKVAQQPMAAVPSAIVADSVATVEVPKVAAASEQPTVATVVKKHSGQQSTVVYPFQLSRSKGNRLTAKLYMQNAMADSRRSDYETLFRYRTVITSHTEYVQISGGNSSPEEIYFEGEDGKDGRDGIDGVAPPETDPTYVPVLVHDTLTAVGAVPVVHRQHHRQPVRLGISLRYQLSNRWSVESGLTYTRLITEVSTTMDNQTTYDEQHQHYIGVPLNVGYLLWSSRRFSFYASAGGTIEKQLEQSPWQLSANAAIGVDYRLTPWLSLYAEPGIGYYFDNRSTTPVLYHNRPLNLSLGVGLRFSLGSTPE